MKLKEQAIKKLDELKPEALARVYDLIVELKRTEQAGKSSWRHTHRILELKLLLPRRTTERQPT